MEYVFGQASKHKLDTCDDRLVRVMQLALTLTKYDFGISCGIRTIEEQRKLVDLGKSLTMNSLHLPNKVGKSNAVDIKVYVGSAISWEEKHFRKVAGAVFKAAFQLGIEIEWGGHWENLNDMPHFQLAKES